MIFSFKEKQDFNEIYFILTKLDAICFRDHKSLVEKDVARTDRTRPFFHGQNNPNLQVLHDILLTYVFYNFNLGESSSILLRMICLLGGVMMWCSDLVRYVSSWISSLGTCVYLWWRGVKILRLHIWNYEKNADNMLLFMKLLIAFCYHL